MSENVIEITNLHSGYGKMRVLFDVNFFARAGEITVVVGPNGAGKTTLLNSIMGIATIHSGSIKFEGIDVTRLPAYKKARMGIAYLPQYGNVASGLTVEENLRMAGYLLDRNEVKERIYEVIDLFPKLRELLDRKAGSLSGGERRMLAIGIALMRKPKVLLLDEMTTDLAPIIVNQVLSKIAELRDRFKKTVIMVEQNAKKALEIGNRAYLIVSGRVKFEGESEELLNDPQLSKLYLGISK